MLAANFAKMLNKIDGFIYRNAPGETWEKKTVKLKNQH